MLQDLAKSAVLHLPGDAPILHLIDDNVNIVAGTSQGEIHVLEWRESGLAHMHVMKEHTAAIRGKRQANISRLALAPLSASHRMRRLQRPTQTWAMSKTPNKLAACWHDAELCLLLPHP